MSRNVVSCTQPAGQGNDFELIPRVQMKSQRSVGWSTCHDFSRFAIISEISRPKSEVVEDGRPKFASLEEKDPLRTNFHKCFAKRIHGDIAPRLVCKFREIWLTGKRQRRALFTSQKQNFGSISRSRLCADRAQNPSGPALDNILGQLQISSESVHIQRSYSRTREHR